MTTRVRSPMYYNIENKTILIFVKDVRCEAQTPVDLKERVSEPLGTYSPRPGTGASQNASRPRATARISRNVCAQSKRGSTGVCTGYLKYNMTKSKYHICINLEFLVGIKRYLYLKYVT